MKRQVVIHCDIYASKREIFKEWKGETGIRKLSIGQVSIPVAEIEIGYGFKRNRQGEVLINPDEAEVIQEIFRMHLFGISLNGMCEKLTQYKAIGFDIPYKLQQERIRDILHNEKYAGYKFVKKGKKLIVQDIGEGIVTKRIFAMAQGLRIMTTEKSQKERLGRLAKVVY